MKVSDLIKELKKYNQNATIEIVVDCKPYTFEVFYGGFDNCTKDNCTAVRMANIEDSKETT